MEQTSNTSAVFAIGRRGGLTIILKGYKFLKQRSNGARSRWWCGTHRDFGCKAVIYTLNDEIIKCNAEHNHDPPAERYLPWPSQVKGAVKIWNK